MSAIQLSPTPLALRIRKATRAATKGGILEAQTVNALGHAADRLGHVETLHAPKPWSTVPASWRQAAIAVAQIETELAQVAKTRTSLWRPSGSAGLLRLTVALDAFPAEFEAIHHQGMNLEIREDEHHSVWIGLDGDEFEDEWSAPIRPEMGETLADCVRRFGRELRDAG